MILSIVTVAILIGSTFVTSIQVQTKKASTLDLCAKACLDEKKTPCKYFKFVNATATCYLSSEEKPDFSKHEKNQTLDVNKPKIISEKIKYVVQLGRQMKAVKRLLGVLQSLNRLKGNAAKSAWKKGETTMKALAMQHRKIQDIFTKLWGIKFLPKLHKEYQKLQEIQIRELKKWTQSQKHHKQKETGKSLKDHQRKLIHQNKWFMAKIRHLLFSTHHLNRKIRMLQKKRPTNWGRILQKRLDGFQRKFGMVMGKSRWLHRQVQLTNGRLNGIQKSARISKKAKHLLTQALLNLKRSLNHAKRQINNIPRFLRNRRFMRQFRSLQKQVSLLSRFKGGIRRDVNKASHNIRNLFRRLSGIYSQIRMLNSVTSRDRKRTSYLTLYYKNLTKLTKILKSPRTPATYLKILTDMGNTVKKLQKRVKIHQGMHLTLQHYLKQRKHVIRLVLRSLKSWVTKIGKGQQRKINNIYRRMNSEKRFFMMRLRQMAKASAQNVNGQLRGIRRQLYKMQKANRHVTALIRKDSNKRFRLMKRRPLMQRRLHLNQIKIWRVVSWIRNKTRQLLRQTQKRKNQARRKKNQRRSKKNRHHVNARKGAPNRKTPTRRKRNQRRSKKSNHHVNARKGAPNRKTPRRRLINARKRQRLINARKRQRLINARKRQRQINARKRQKQINARRRQRLINARKRQRQINARKRQRQITARKRQKQINARRQRLINARKRQRQINARKRQRQINARKRQKQINARKRQRLINARKRQRQINARKRQRQINARKIQKQINARKRQRLINARKKQKQINARKRQRPIYSRKKQRQIDARKRRRLINARKRQRLINARKRQRQINARKKQRLMNARKRRKQINARKRQKQINARKRQRLINARKKQRLINARKRQRQINARKRQKQINARKRQRLINARKKQRLINARKRQRLINARKRQKQINARKKQRLINARKRQRLINSRKRQRPIHARKNQRQINARKRQRLINARKRQKQINARKRQKQINARKRRRLINARKRQRLINARKRQRQINARKRQRQINARKIQRLINARKRQRQINARKKQRLINARKSAQKKVKNRGKRSTINNGIRGLRKSTKMRKKINQRSKSHSLNKPRVYRRLERYCERLRRSEIYSKKLKLFMKIFFGRSRKIGSRTLGRRSTPRKINKRGKRGSYQDIQKRRRKMCEIVRRNKAKGIRVYVRQRSRRPKKEGFRHFITRKIRIDRLRRKLKQKIQAEERQRKLLQNNKSKEENIVEQEGTKTQNLMNAQNQISKNTTETSHNRAKRYLIKHRVSPLLLRKQPRKPKRVAKYHPRKSKGIAKYQPSKSKGVGKPKWFTKNQPRKPKGFAKNRLRNSKGDAKYHQRKPKWFAKNQPRKPKGVAKYRPRKPKGVAKYRQRNSKWFAKYRPRKPKGFAKKRPRNSKGVAKYRPRKPKAFAKIRPRKPKGVAKYQPRKPKGVAKYRPRRPKGFAKNRPRKHKSIAKFRLPNRKLTHTQGVINVSSSHPYSQEVKISYEVKSGGKKKRNLDNESHVFNKQTQTHKGVYCSKPYTAVGQSCLVASKTKYSLKQAVTTCMSLNGLPVSIQTAEKQKDVMKFIQTLDFKHIPKFWMAPMQYENYSFVWTVDRKPVTYSNFKTFPEIADDVCIVLESFTYNWEAQPCEENEMDKNHLLCERTDIAMEHPTVTPPTKQNATTSFNTTAPTAKVPKRFVDDFASDYYVN